MLTDKAVKAAKAKDRQYKLADHSSMYLLVKPNGAKLWQYSFTLFGKEGTFSIGEYPHVTLAEARTKQVWARSQIKEGRHPTRVQQDERDVLARAASEESANSLGAIWDEWNKKSSPSLSSPTRKQRVREVEQNIPEKFRARPINSITRRQLADLLSPIDERAPSVAKNVRQHLHSMFERAIHTGRLESNPVPPSSVLTSYKSKPHSALHGARLGDFLHAVDENHSIELKTKTSMLLMMFTVLRKVEVTGAKWKEFDLDTAEWLVPQERMKERVEHWVPLSTQAVELLKAWRLHVPMESELLFPNRRDASRPMAGVTLNALMRRLGFGKEGTPHGMRSAFSTHFNRFNKDSDVIEKCLSHGPIDPVRAAYNRYEYEDPRRKMLQDWADLLDKIRDAAEQRAQLKKVQST